MVKNQLYFTMLIIPIVLIKNTEIEFVKGFSNFDEDCKSHKKKILLQKLA